MQPSRIMFAMNLNLHEQKAKLALKPLPPLVFRIRTSRSIKQFNLLIRDGSLRLRRGSIQPSHNTYLLKIAAATTRLWWAIKTRLGPYLTICATKVKTTTKSLATTYTVRLQDASQSAINSLCSAMRL